MFSRVTDTILMSQFRTFWSNNQFQAWKTQNNAKCPKLADTRFSNLWCNQELAGVFYSGSRSRSKIRHNAQGWPLFNIFNQIVKVKVEIRECFLIQYFFFSTGKTLYFFCLPTTFPKLWRQNGVCHAANHHENAQKLGKGS